MIDNAQDLIKDHESYREGIYLDSLGYPTTGYGFCLDFSKPFKTVKEWHEAMFQKNFQEAEQMYIKLGLDLDPVRQAAVLDLLYNMKTKFPKQFGETITHLRNHEFEEAARHLRNTLWFKQVKRRGPRITELIRTGRWEVLNEV